MGGSRHPGVTLAFASALAATALGACGGSPAHLRTHEGFADFIHSEAGDPPGRAYLPSARHAGGPPHAVYGDEVGENVVGTPHRRIAALFGPPLRVRRSATGPCLYYRVVGQRMGWEFCFVRGRMESAAGMTERRFVAQR